MSLRRTLALALALGLLAPMIATAQDGGLTIPGADAGGPAIAPTPIPTTTPAPTPTPDLALESMREVGECLGNIAAARALAPVLPVADQGDRAPGLNTISYNLDGFEEGWKQRRESELQRHVSASNALRALALMNAYAEGHAASMAEGLAEAREFGTDQALTSRFVKVVQCHSALTRK